MATGDEAWPFDTGATGENEWEQLWGPIMEDGVVGSPGSNVAQVYADGSGMQVKRRAGKAWLHGGYVWRNLTETVILVAVNSSSNPRVDRIVLRRSLTANTVTTEIKQGIPATSPLPPALTQTEGGVWELSLAQVRVPGGAGTTGNAIQTLASTTVTDDRPWRSLRTWVVTNQSQLPATGVPLWQPAVDAFGTRYRWNGTAWVGTYPLQTSTVQLLQDVTPVAVVAGTNAIRYQIVDGWVMADADLQVSALGPTAGGRVQVVLPAALPIRAPNTAASPKGQWTGLLKASGSTATFGPQGVVVPAGIDTQTIAFRMPISNVGATYLGDSNDGMNAGTTTRGIRLAVDSILSFSLHYRIV
jgi:hypothetical protein